MTQSSNTLNSTVNRALPGDWRLVKLKDVVQINPRRPSNLSRSDDAPTSFVPMKTVDEVTGSITKIITRPFGEIKQGYTYFAEGDVLFAKITPCMQNGKHAIARRLTDGIGFGTTEFHVLRPGPDVIAEWIHYFVRQPTLLLKATEHFTGAVGQQRLPADYLANLDFPLPPLDEQKRIVAILNGKMAAVERARKAAEERLAAAKALPAAILCEVFPQPGQPLPNGWQWVRLGEVCDIAIGKTPARDIPRFWNGNLPWVSISDMKEETIVNTKEHITKAAVTECNCRLVPAGTLLFSFKLTIGKMAFAGCDLYTNEAIAALTPVDNRNLAKEYLRFALSFSDCTKQSSHAVKGRTLNQDGLKAITIPLPPLAEQKRIAAVLNEQMAAAEWVRKAAEEELKTINALPAAILRRAFSGEL